MKGADADVKARLALRSVPHTPLGVHGRLWL